MTTENQLLPCPFCGCEPTDHAIEPHSHSFTLDGFKMPDHKGSHVIECKCGAGFVADTLNSATALWNARAALTQPAQPASQEPKGLGMGTQALAGELAEALNKDTQSENSLGMLGQHTMAWLRQVAAEYLRQPASQEQAQQPAPHMVPIEAVHEVERERDYWRTRAKTLIDHANGEFWGWQGDGEDHLESLANSLPVVIRADQLRELLACQDSGGEVGWRSLPATLDRLAAWLRNPANADGCEALALSFAEWCQAVVSARTALLATPKPEPMTEHQRGNLVMEHLGPAALAGDKMSPLDAFTLGIEATECFHGITKEQA